MNVPRHCKHCVMLIKHVNGAYWCCSKGASAVKAVGWCKIHEKKVTK